MQEKENDIVEIDLKELALYLLYKAWIIVLCGVIAGAAGFLFSSFAITPQYDSTTGIYIMNKNNNTTLSYSDVQLATQLTKDYEELITCRYVLEEVISQCGLTDSYADLKGRVEVTNKSGTHIIYITVKDPIPTVAQRIADNIREVASEHIRSVTDVEAVNIVDMANLPARPSEPSVKKWTVLGAAIGIFLGAAVLVVIYMMDDTIKSADDVEKYLGWSTLALIPVMQAETRNTRKKARNASSRRKTDGSEAPRREPVRMVKIQPEAGLKPEGKAGTEAYAKTESRPEANEMDAQIEHIDI